jgi:prepilin-type N-terminal cleavage/methylation domain-containing protein
MKNTTLGEPGFTLIELLIVVVIIGILASIAIPKFTAVRERAYLSAVKADLRNLANLQDVYYNEHYVYSTNATDLDFTGTEGVALTLSEGTNQGWSASASHAGLAAESCAIFHGNATPVTPATVESTVQCTR